MKVFFLKSGEALFNGNPWAFGVRNSFAFAFYVFWLPRELVERIQ